MADAICDLFAVGLRPTRGFAQLLHEVHSNEERIRLNLRWKRKVDRAVALTCVSAALLLLRRVATTAPKVILFDAAGTLFHLPKSVGYHYALVGRRLGLPLDEQALDRAFLDVWKSMPQRAATSAPREDDDKGWWREVVDRVFEQVAPATKDLDRDAFFEVAYEHFAEAGVWELFPDVVPVLEKVEGKSRLAVVSNFDGRLRMILEQLGIGRFFPFVVISSEVGADKPDPLIYRRALELCEAAPHQALHVGDDPVRDWAGAEAAGIRVFKLQRPHNSLHDLLSACAVG
jgi:putative hydrolase of the HAD superfamily